MCEFQRYTFDSPLPLMCDYTKKVCTLCVWGNMKTYEEAIKAKEGSDNNANT